MLFLDCTLDILPNGTILLDNELTFNLIHAKPGDEYTLKDHNGRAVFVKKSVVEDGS